MLAAKLADLSLIALVSMGSRWWGIPRPERAPLCVHRQGDGAVARFRHGGPRRQAVVRKTAAALLDDRGRARRASSRRMGRAVACGAGEPRIPAVLLPRSF